jgi:hypothetical protein
MSLLLLFQGGAPVPPPVVVVDTHDGGDERAREYWARVRRDAELPAPLLEIADEAAEPTEDAAPVLEARAVMPSVDWAGAYDRAASLEACAAILARRMAEDEEDAEWLLLMA